MMYELRWSLERYLDYPFAPELDHANQVCDALRQWGTRAFVALFGSRVPGGWFDNATREQYARLCIRVSSDDPRILAWPWEALWDPKVGPLAHHCQFERRLHLQAAKALGPACLANPPAFEPLAHRKWHAMRALSRLLPLADGGYDFREGGFPYSPGGSAHAGNAIERARFSSP